MTSCKIGKITKLERDMHGFSEQWTAYRTIYTKIVVTALLRIIVSLNRMLNFCRHASTHKIGYINERTHKHIHGSHTITYSIIHSRDKCLFELPLASIKTSWPISNRRQNSPNTPKCWYEKKTTNINRIASFRRRERDFMITIRNCEWFLIRSQF